MRSKEGQGLASRGRRGRHQQQAYCWQCPFHSVQRPLSSQGACKSLGDKELETEAPCQPALEQPICIPPAPAPPPYLWGLLSPQLWPGPRRPSPGARTTEPQPDCGDLAASQHGGLGHEDGASEQPAGGLPSQGKGTWWVGTTRPGLTHTRT